MFKINDTRNEYESYSRSCSTAAVIKRPARRVKAIERRMTLEDPGLSVLTSNDSNTHHNALFRSSKLSHPRDHLSLR